MSDPLFSLVAIALTAAVPQQSPARSPTISAQDGSEPDDIVVTGYRESKSRETRVQTPALVSSVRNRQRYEYSERVAKCAARSRLSDRSRLRDVVDGEFNHVTQLVAQDRLKRIYISCSESGELLRFTAPPQTDLQLSGGITGDLQGVSNIADAAPLGRSIYDRGAFTIQALKMFAPDLKLTGRQTNDAAVQARFNERETKRNRFRLPSDYRYFEVAVCMVRVEPRLAVRLALSDGAARLGDVQEALIDRARVCIGGTRNVQVDPTQFRLYIADAVYRWAVAARGVDSLIPASS